MKLSNILSFVIACLMLLVSSYLTWHFYEVYFPTQATGGVLCNLSSFWNCDITTFSPLGHIFYIPTGSFGVFFSLLLLLGFMPRLGGLCTFNYLLTVLNFLGCLVLLAYSLVFLKGLCPGCFAYYVLSGLLLLTYPKPHRVFEIPRMLTLSLYGLLAVLSFSGIYWFNAHKFKEQETLAKDWAKELLKTQNYSSLQKPFTQALITSSLENPPLQILIFSDFECPACKQWSEMLPHLKARYGDLLQVEFAHFPLDPTCNQSVSSAFHPHACLAAKLAVCATAHQFETLHDDLYAHQHLFSPYWLGEKASQLGLQQCYQHPKTLEDLIGYVNQAKVYEIQATPTWFINGYKLEGVLPVRFVMLLLDALLNQPSLSKQQ